MDSNDSNEDSGTCQLPASADGSVGKIVFTDDIDVLDIVDFPCLVDDDTIEFLRSHGRILFLSRGPPGSGKGTVATRLHELYPGSRIYWSDKMFLTPLAPPRTKETLKQSHDLCMQKITEYMQQNAPVIINRNTNMGVWETSPYLRIAAMYGYTVIILNIDKNLILKPEVLAVTNSKGLDQSYMKNRLKQWENIYPYAMGWSPRPRDAAFLLCRYRELSAGLANNGIVLKPIQCEQFFPFCIARLCWFGWDERDRHYCHSEPVKKAYGSKDRITVLGYAAVGDLIMAVVELTEAQAALMGGSELPASLETAISRHANDHECDEMLCTVDLHNMSVQNDSDETVVLEEGAACRELPPPSRMSFILLGSTTAKAIKYSSAVLHASLLHNHMRSWRDTGAAPRMCVDADGVSVYGTPTDASDDMCLLITDKKTVRLDAIFTGHYQAHTSRLSGRDRMWSTGNKKCVSQDHHTFDRYLQNTATMRTAHREPDSYPADVVRQVLDSVDAPCLKHDGTRQYLSTHGRLLILVRGPSGSGKDIVAARLEELYMGSSKPAGSSDASEPTTASVPPGTALNKIEGYMKNDTPVLYSYTDIMVWHITKYLALASKYGYTVVIVDMPHQPASDAKQSAAQPSVAAAVAPEAPARTTTPPMRLSPAPPNSVATPADAAVTPPIAEPVLALPAAAPTTMPMSSDQTDSLAGEEQHKKDEENLGVFREVTAVTLAAMSNALEKADAETKEDVSEAPASCTAEDMEDGEENEEAKEEDDEENGSKESGDAKAPMLKNSYREDQWSPLNPEGRKQYDRQFLLMLQGEPMSLTKPFGLPNLDIIKDTDDEENGSKESGDAKAPMLKLSYCKDQWSPLNPEGRKQYDRQFLLMLQGKPMCLKKLSGLPKLDIITDTAMLHKLPNLPRGGPYQGSGETSIGGGPSRGAMVRGAHPEHLFMPPYARNSVRGGGPSRRQSQPGCSGDKPKKVITLSSSLHPGAACGAVKLHVAQNAWKPLHKSAAEIVDEEAASAKALSKAMGESNQVKRWEEVHPFAMGWSPRPRDAAWLLQRFRQIRNTLHNEDPKLAPRDVASSHVYPFCLARLCLFGSSAADKDYCLSEKVRQAYGRSDTLRVFGYAVTQGFVFAMVELSDDQATLTGHLDIADENDGDVGAVTRQLSLRLGFRTWEEVGCIVDLAKFAPTEGCADRNDLHFVGNRINLKDLQPSRVTFMPLGSIDGTDYSYSKAVAAPWQLLSSKLRSWRAAKVNCVRSVNDIEVCGSAVSTDDACLLVIDHATIELDVVFTGYYQPHTTSLSGRSWSHAQNAGSTRPPFNRGGRCRPFNRFH
ncbi:uncharacterized protein LOC119389993 isoform X1 [Rhipicephalus sanguineus]|uniref:uncharacterized protein LOC119389993 isoform X1 n=1 Tax=Rhipicephalus sanguineus TaxID=34632 RepID=UPI0020C5383F|nr:uncharacterized protein LOC119389993 isoform X1 [Rhipicephalus sanguineus]